MTKTLHFELSTQAEEVGGVVREPRTYTVDEALTAIGMAADAVEVMILTFLLPILSEEWNLSESESGTIGALVFAGMFIGGLVWAQLSDRYGRRTAVIWANTGQIIFGMLSAAAWNLWSMMLLRFLTGFCLGASSCGFTLYAEFAPAANRGKLLIFQQGFWAFGAFFNSLLAWLVLETLDWRWYLIISSFPLILIVYLAWKVPESVQYLVAIGERDQAESILRRAAVVNKCKEADSLQYLRLTEHTAIFDKRGNPMEVLDRKYFRTTLACLVIMCTSTVAYYGVSFLSERFFDQIGAQNNDGEADKYWKVAVTTSSEIPGVLVAILTLDRIGRKRSLMMYFGITAIACFGLIHNKLQNIEWLSVLLVFIERGFALCALCAIYVYVSEFYPTRVRNTALGWAAALGRMSGMSTTYLSMAGSSYSFLILGLVSSFGFVATALLQQDTTGVDLSAEIDDLQIGGVEKQKVYG